MSCGTENIVLEPVDVFVGKDQVQVQTITCVADDTSSLQNKYILFYEPSGVRHYAWFNVATLGVDPAISGYTAHPVAIAANATANAVASALNAVITALTEFNSTASGAIITVTNVTNGYAPAAHDALSVPSQTGFAFELVTVGDLYEKVGYLEGNVEVSNLSNSPVDIKTHQSGATIVGQLLSGGNPELKFNLLEVTLEKYKKIKRYIGGEYVPVVSGSVGLVGGGRKGKNKAPQYARVVLHPVSKDAADKSKDYCFWKCLIDLDSVSFSGENVLTLPVSVKAFEDCDKPSEVSVYSIGDWTVIEPA